VRRKQGNRGRDSDERNVDEQESPTDHELTARNGRQPSECKGEYDPDHRPQTRAKQAKNASEKEATYDRKQLGLIHWGTSYR